MNARPGRLYERGGFKQIKLIGLEKSSTHQQKSVVSMEDQTMMF